MPPQIVCALLLRIKSNEINLPTLRLSHIEHFNRWLKMLDTAKCLFMLAQNQINFPSLCARIDWNLIKSNFRLAIDIAAIYCSAILRLGCVFCMTRIISIGKQISIGYYAPLIGALEDLCPSFRENLSVFLNFCWFFLLRSVYSHFIFSRWFSGCCQGILWCIVTHYHKIEAIFN